MIVAIGRAVLIRGDCYDYAARLVATDGLISDPPYGIGYRVNARRLRAQGLDSMGPSQCAAKEPIVGDDRPFDARPWLGVPRLAFFGANLFSAQLPIGRKWIVWDKRRDSASDDHSDCELIWTNAQGALRIHRQKWRGVVREGEENCSRSKKLHPNQKPVALMGAIIRELGLDRGMTVADPYMGSGSTGIAAIRAGLRFVGCEIDPRHFETAVARFETEHKGLIGSTEGGTP